MGLSDKYRLGAGLFNRYSTGSITLTGPCNQAPVSTVAIDISAAC